MDNGRLYLLSGGRERSDWVRNLQANPRVMVELDDETHTATARKYREGDDLDEWGRTALPIVIEFSAPAGQEMMIIMS